MQATKQAGRQASKQASQPARKIASHSKDRAGRAGQEGKGREARTHTVGRSADCQEDAGLKAWGW